MPNGELLFPFDETTEHPRRDGSRDADLSRHREAHKRKATTSNGAGLILHKAGHFTGMPNGRALFSVLNPPDRRAAAGKFYLATRRGKQFNSMTFGATDRLMGAKSRDIIFISPKTLNSLR